MKRTDGTANTLELLRDLPAEVTIDQVAQLVVAFPLAATTTSWLAHIKIHLNSILMTTAGSLIIGGSIYLMSADGPSSHLATMQEPAPSTVVEAMATPTTLEEPAVVLEMPTIVPGNEPEIAPSPTTIDVPLIDPTPRSPSGPHPMEVASVFMMPIPPIAPGGAVVLRTDGSGKAFDLSGFTAVALHGYMDVLVEQGEFAVRATGETEALERLTLVVQNGTLIVDIGTARSGKGECSAVEGVKVVVHMPQLDRVEVLGSGSVETGAFSTGGSLALHLQGSGDIHLAQFDELASINIELGGSGDIVADGVRVKGSTKVELSGSGDVRMAGSTGQIDVNLIGSGDVDMSELEAGTGKVRVVGSGDAYVNCTGTLDQRVQGSGDIHPSGSAGGNRPRGVGAQTY